LTRDLNQWTAKGQDLEEKNAVLAKKASFFETLSKNSVAKENEIQDLILKQSEKEEELAKMTTGVCLFVIHC
jgi:hypothetical protein